MNGQGKLLTHYLKNADKLIIPVYQRNYDWREEHCRKLYQDLVRTIRDRKRWHFFGELSLLAILWAVVLTTSSLMVSNALRPFPCSFWLWPT